MRTQIYHLTTFEDRDVSQLTESFNSCQAYDTSLLVYINSHGGHTHNCAAIADILSSGKTTITSVVGKAFSAGCVAAGFGTVGHRYATKMSRFMMHHCQFLMPQIDLKNGAKLIQEYCEFDEVVYKGLAQHCGKPDNYFLDIINDGKDVFFGPEEALKHGLIDHIGMPQFNTTGQYQQTYKATS